MQPLSTLEWLFLTAVLSLLGGMGGRAVAIWNERKARELLADQVETMFQRFGQLRSNVDEQLDSFGKRLSRREGAEGQQRKKRNEVDENEIAKALQAAVDREKAGKKRTRDHEAEPTDEEVAEALKRLAENEHAPS